MRPVKCLQYGVTTAMYTAGSKRAAQENSATGSSRRVVKYAIGKLTTVSKRKRSGPQRCILQRPTSDARKMSPEAGDHK